MGFRFTFGKTNKIARHIDSYVSARLKEKNAFEQQLTRLDAQLHANTINKQSYEQFRDLLEIKFIQAREEALTEIHTKF